MKHSPLSRTSITLPPRELAAADRIAASLDRSRSWVFSEAIRRWAEPLPGAAERESSPAPPSVPRPVTVPAPSITPAAALRLSPAARLTLAQELMADFRREHPRAVRLQIIGFETQEDFLEWKRDR